MGTTVSTKAIKELRAAVLALCCSTFLLPAAAAELEAEITLGVTHTDNIFLTMSPTEIDDLVYSVSPKISFIRETPHYDVNLRYRFAWRSYDDVDATSSYHMGEASLTGKLWQESLAVEVGVRRAQMIKDPNQSIPSSRLPVSGNLVDRDDVYINPRLRRALGQSVTLAASYRYSEGLYNDPLIQEDSNHVGEISVDNYNAGQGLAWALRYDRRETDYEVSRDWEYQKATAELGYWINSKLRLFGSGGKESPSDDVFNSSLEDDFWEAGFAFAGGQSISAEFAVGERSFGSSWRGMLDYTFRRGSTSLSYNESPSTTNFHRIFGRRDVLDPDDFDEFLDVPGRAERFLSKRLRWDLNLEFRRTGLSVTLFDEDRTGRTPLDGGAPLGNQSQQGLRVGFTWQAGARTEFSTTGSIIRREDGPLSESKLIWAGFRVDYRLGTRMSLALEYGYNEQRPEVESLTAPDYVANVVSLFLTYTL